MQRTLVRAVINKYINLRQMLEKEGYYIAPNGTMFCPYHANEHTKAAHFYENDGGGQIFCFAEYRQFTPYDHFKILHPDIDLEQLAQSIFDRLTPEQQEYIQQTVNLSDVEKELPYLQALEVFKNRECNYEQLMQSIHNILGKDETTEMVESLYNLEDVKTFDNSNKYLYFMHEYETPYKLLSAYKILSSQKDLPDFVYQHLESTGDCILLPNIIDGQIYSITFRSLKSDKRFLKYGEFSTLIYNLGNFPKDFKYGTPILVVEGNIDCDVAVKELYPYTVAALTSNLTKNQIEILSHLTNNIILALDNDEAGDEGYIRTCGRLRKKGLHVQKFKHSDGMKDFGDLIELRRTDYQEFERVRRYYKERLRLLLEEC